MKILVRVGLLLFILLSGLAYASSSLRTAGCPSGLTASTLGNFKITVGAAEQPTRLAIVVHN